VEKADFRGKNPGFCGRNNGILEGCVVKGEFSE
jgi:hypothetical protein